MPVYEVRSHQGAAWRGAVIVDAEGDWWLVHADTHDRFHASTADVLSSSSSSAFPSRIDQQLRDRDRAARLTSAEDIELLQSFCRAMERAVNAPGSDSLVPLPKNMPAKVLVRIDFSEVSNSVDTMHESTAEVTVSMTIDADNDNLRSRFLGLYVPFLQPNAELREQVYGPDYRRILLNLLVTHAQLAQFLTIATDGHVARRQPAAPAVLHWAGINELTAGYVLGKAVKALCGVWFVPTRDGDSAPDLPICEECESIQPVAQKLQSLIKRIEASGSPTD
ncbi:MAG: DUF3039 domain-containing protein [Corynebacterium sp.]|uniref:DUF3039 domain-containing protein n=1 Tax=Corynebacterium sp. TaxID=1720 RepID=UPI0026DFD3B4|nr:DUF3039 domain-containing protein [Corynebacterium sp.]MDO5669944.1 DUF3039 domain-containing protein [Corynebacterium sp.]